MSEHIYKIVELAGSSDQGVQHAIEVAIARAAATTRNLRWFEVLQVRGHIADGKVEHYQVTLKAGFTLEDPSVR
jgi:flavin-binding protein dodecin